MKRLIKFLELERDASTGKAKVQFQDWILELEKRYPTRTALAGQKSCDKRNKTGIKGIGYSRGIYWVTYYKSDGTYTSKRFNTHVHGAEKAFHMACEFRFEAIGELYIYDLDVIPYEIKVPYTLAKPK